MNVCHLHLMRCRTSAVQTRLFGILGYLISVLPAQLMYCPSFVSMTIATVKMDEVTVEDGTSWLELDVELVD